MVLTSWLALALIAVAVAIVFRGVDVRLVLFLCALALGCLAGNLAPIIREFLGTFSNEKFVVPICSAMGFAHVLRYTECDGHLVRLLVSPVQRVRFLMVPAVVLIGFAVNIPVISQSSTAVCLGTVAVPVMRAAGFTPVTIGSALLLGCSIGGELLNPGAPELLTISTDTGVPTTAMLGAILRLVIPSLIVATLVFWAMDLWADSRNKTTSKDVVQELTSSGKEPQSLNLFKATVPLVPLVLLFVASAPLNWVAIPSEWLLSSAVKSSATKPDTLYSTRLIGLAMLVGVGVAILASPGRILKVMKTFFEGAGYGFTHIISLIVTATCFGKGIEEVGLARNLGDLIAHSAGLLQPLAGLVPAGFAFISGSGMASTQSLYGFFHGPAVSLGQDPIAIGAMVSVGSAAGRTMSPVSAVTLMSAELTGTRPFDLVWRVLPPLVIGLLVTVALRMFRLI